MKSFLYIFLFISTFSFSQKKITVKKIDSLVYYDSLRSYFVKALKYKDALIYTQKAIHFSGVNNKPQALITENFNLGKLYYEVKKYDDAIKYFNTSLAISKKFSPNRLQASTYYYLGMCFMQKRSYNIAQINFSKAESLRNTLKIVDTSDSINLQQGIIYKAVEKYDLASTLFTQIIAKPDDVTILNSKSEALYQIGTIEMANNRNNLALNYLKKALKINSKTKNLEQKSAILLALSMVYDKMLDKNSAYVFLKQHNNLEESITIIDNAKLGVDDYEKFKESERLKEIKQIDEIAKQQEKSSKFSKLISILAIALISILSLLSLSLYKNNIIRTQTNHLLEEKNKELIIAKEKVEKASHARSDFLSTVSHELRTPLNAINGIAHLLLEEKPKKSQMQYLESLRFSGNYLTKFINDILEINKIDSKKVEIEHHHFNLKKLLANIHSSLKELAAENDNNFNFKIDHSIPDYLIGDPTKLSQILLNLINNALKFTLKGDVTVIAELISSEENKFLIYFEVSDNGIGIPKEKLESVFDSFSQGSVDINRKYGGTGLGLTIVKKLVKILGGNIQLESVVKEGSCFSFLLPFQLGEKPLKIAKNSKPKKDCFFSNKKILIVEDNKINQMITRKMLENKGVICEIIDNGEDSIAICKTNKYDLILMDVHLPGINGTIATQELRNFDTVTPIIALTAISLNENREMLMSYGMNDVITKPFVPEDFYSIIAKYL